MPRSGSGVYTLPQAPFIPLTVIKSADVNSDFSDIAATLTLSLATNGVSSMTGQLKAFGGSQPQPGYAFASALSTGFFLSAANEISLVNNGVVTAVFGASTTVTFNGNVIYSSLATFNGGVLTSSLEVTVDIILDKQALDPTTVAANKVALYVKSDGFGTIAPFFETSVLAPTPLMFTGGQCQLNKSGANLQLLPYGGNRLTVNGIPCVIPDAGVALPASNSAGVFVYIYAVATIGVVSSLEMSTTAPTTQVGTGVKQKTGDATRTLVGAAFTDAGGAWADTDGKLWVLSYYNRRRKVSRTTLTVQQVTATANYIEVDASMRNQFINWSDENLIVYSKMALNSTTIDVGVFNQHNLDGTTPGDSQVVAAPAVVNIPSMMNNYSTFGGMTEAALHYISLFARTIGGTTLTISLGASSKENTCIYITVNG